MAGIGGIECDFVRGQRAALKPRVKTWTAPGIRGYGAFKSAKSDAPFRFTAVLFHNAQTIENWGRLIEQLQSKVISIVDDWNVEHFNLLVVRVGPLRKTVALKNNPNPIYTGARGEIVVEGVQIDG